MRYLIFYIIYDFNTSNDPNLLNRNHPNLLKIEDVKFKE